VCQRRVPPVDWCASAGSGGGGVHLVAWYVVVHVAARVQHGPAQPARHHRIRKLLLRVKNGRSPLLCPLRVDAELAGDKALHVGGYGCSKQVRHGGLDDFNIDPGRDEYGVCSLENSGELGNVVVGTAELKGCALGREVLQCGFVLGVLDAADNGQARKFLAK